MCAVTAIPALIGLGISIASTAVSTGLQVDAASKASAARQEAAAQNVRIVQAQRNATIQEAGYQARDVEIQGRRAGAAGLTVAAQAGVSTQTGSLKNIPAVSVFKAASDAETLRSAAARQAWGYDIQKEGFLKEGRAARKAGFLGSLSAGLSGTAQLGGFGIQGTELIRTYG